MINFEIVFSDMLKAATGEVKEGAKEITDYINEIFHAEKQTMLAIAQARLQNQLSDDQFQHELDREKKVLETQLLTTEIMGKATAQKAINAAMNVLKDAIKLAI